MRPSQAAAQLPQQMHFQAGTGLWAPASVLVARRRVRASCPGRQMEETFPTWSSFGWVFSLAGKMPASQVRCWGLIPDPSFLLTRPLGDNGDARVAGSCLPGGRPGLSSRLSAWAQATSDWCGCLGVTQ